MQQYLDEVETAFFRPVKILIHKNPLFFYIRSPKQFVFTGNFDKIWPEGGQRAIWYTAWKNNKDAYN
jgi:hypothetical protein